MGLLEANGAMRYFWNTGLEKKGSSRKGVVEKGEAVLRQNS
jgi:hypothetical protein